MKVKVDCKSPLLEYSLKYFLKEYLDENGIVITDDPEKDGLLIGKDITKPFTKTTLLLQLEKNLPKNENFEEKLDKLIDEFAKNLKNLIKEYYGKK
jgi:hypothetical protein